MTCLTKLNAPHTAPSEASKARHMTDIPTSTGDIAQTLRFTPQTSRFVQAGGSHD